MELNSNLQDELAKLLKIIRWILILIVCLSLLSILVAMFSRLFNHDCYEPFKMVLAIFGVVPYLVNVFKKLRCRANHNTESYSFF